MENVSALLVGLMDELANKVRWVGVRLGCGLIVGVIILLLVLLVSYT